MEEPCEILVTIEIIFIEKQMSTEALRIVAACFRSTVIASLQNIQLATPLFLRRSNPGKKYQIKSKCPNFFSFICLQNKKQPEDQLTICNAYPKMNR